MLFCFLFADILLNKILFVFYRCKDTDKQERETKEDKCLFLENSGSEDDVLEILQYMATILGTYAK